MLPSRTAAQQHKNHAPPAEVSNIGVNYGVVGLEAGITLGAPRPALGFWALGYTPPFKTYNSSRTRIVIVLFTSTLCCVYRMKIQIDIVSILQ